MRYPVRIQSGKPVSRWEMALNTLYLLRILYDLSALKLGHYLRFMSYDERILYVNRVIDAKQQQQHKQQQQQ